MQIHLRICGMKLLLKNVFERVFFGSVFLIILNIALSLERELVGPGASFK